MTEGESQKSNLESRVLSYVDQHGSSQVITRETLTHALGVGYPYVSMVVRKLVIDRRLEEKPQAGRKHGRQVRRLYLNTKPALPRIDRTPLRVETVDITRKGFEKSAELDETPTTATQDTDQIFTAIILREPQIVAFPDYSIRVGCLALVNYPPELGGERIEPILINSKFELPKVGTEVKVLFHKNYFARDAKRGECEQDICIWYPGLDD